MFGKQDTIIVDLDGTLCNIGARHPIHDQDKCGEDQVVEAVAHLLTKFAATPPYSLAYTSVILLTGRNDQYRDETEHWLEEHMIAYDELIMRPDKDYAPASQFKQDMYRKHIEPYCNVIFVIEDTQTVVDMWRRLGLFVFQVQATHDNRA